MSFAVRLLIGLVAITAIAMLLAIALPLTPEEEMSAIRDILDGFSVLLFVLSGIVFLFSLIRLHASMTQHKYTPPPPKVMNQRQLQYVESRQFSIPSTAQQSTDKRFPGLRPRPGLKLFQSHNMWVYGRKKEEWGMLFSIKFGHGQARSCYLKIRTNSRDGMLTLRIIPLTKNIIIPRTLFCAKEVLSERRYDGGGFTNTYEGFVKLATGKTAQARWITVYER